MQILDGPLASIVAVYAVRANERVSFFEAAPRSGKSNRASRSGRESSALGYSGGRFYSRWNEFLCKPSLSAVNAKTSGVKPTLLSALVNSHTAKSPGRCENQPLQYVSPVTVDRKPR